MKVVYDFGILPTDAQADGSVVNMPVLQQHSSLREQM